jgi:hypothetical protein
VVERDLGRAHRVLVAGDQAVDYGLATQPDLEDMAEGWRAWARSEDAVFTVVHGEVVARMAAG